MTKTKSPKLVLDQILDLPTAVAGFYVQDAVLTAIKNMKPTPRKIRMEDKINELTEIHKRYTDQLAGSLFDYIALASFGEARHAPYMAKVYISQIVFKWDNHNDSQIVKARRASYRYALKFNPYTFLPVLTELFDDESWKDAYGGQKWATITSTGEMYGKIPNSVFIDRAVDLSHNGGSMFSKDVLFQYYNVSKYCEMLYYKTHLPSILTEEFLWKYPIACQSKPFI